MAYKATLNRQKNPAILKKTSVVVFLPVLTCFHKFKKVYVIEKNHVFKLCSEIRNGCVFSKKLQNFTKCSCC